MVLDFSISILILKKMAITIIDRAFIMKKPYLALIAFLIPCTGAVIVLLFSISMGILGIGIISTLCMALGMATTISLVGVSTILAKKGVTKFIINRPKVNMILQTTLSIIGALLLTLLGILLFTSTL